MAYIDLTQTFTKSMPVYPGDPISKLEQQAWLEKDGYNEYHLSTGMHVGTHIDAPLHMIENGAMIDQIPIDRLIGPGYLVDARNLSKIDSSVLNGEIPKSSILLVYTGWSQRFGESDYFEQYPVLTEDFADRVAELDLKAVGLDTPSPDREPFLVHKKLLSNNVLIIENLTDLDRLAHELTDRSRFNVMALPPKLAADAAPVRVVAVIL